MGAARRLYVYIVAAVSLAALAGGAHLLLSVVLDEIIPARTIGGGGFAREQISLAIALVAVGLTVWGIHWALASRSVRQPGAQGVEERASAIRAAYFGVVQALSLAALLLAGMSIIRAVLGAVLAVETEAFGGLAMHVSMFAVAGTVWLVHGRIRRSDLRAARMRGAAAWLTRLYRYGAAFAALVIALFAVSDVIGTILRAVLDQPTFGLGGDWWRYALASSLGTALAAGAAWWVHWRDAGATIRDAAAIGEDDRSTRLRATYFGAVVVVATFNVSLVVAGALGVLGSLVLGVADGLSSNATTVLLEGVIGPPLAILPFVAAGWLHARYRGSETGALGPAATAGWWRLVRSLVALVGLFLLASGSVQLLSLAIDSAAGSPGFGFDAEGRARTLVTSLGSLVVGALVWIPAWMLVLRHRATDPATERTAVIGRVHLYLVIGAAIVAIVPSAAYFLFRFLDAMLGGGGGARFVTEVSWPLALIIVAAAGAAYHGRILAADLRFSAPAETAEVAIEPGAAAKAPAEPAPVRRTIELLLTGPEGEDLDPVVERLRAGLPPGVALERGGLAPG